jgi:threonyl-tRNA synthetase
VPENILIEFPDGSKKEFPHGTTPQQIAASISHGLEKDSIVADVDGQLVDLSAPLGKDSKIKFLKLKDPAAKSVFRHTASHIMAQAIMRLFPETRLTIGPSVDEGFYYDLDSEHRFTEDDFPKIEAEIRKIIAEDLPIVRKEIPKSEALAIYRKEGNSYKVEILSEIPDEKVSFYHQGDFFDLCRGPHLVSTGRMKFIKLLKVAGAYWRGSEKNKMLQRIYAEAFASEQEWAAYQRRMEEAEKRDHRKLGKELDLFSIQDSAGPGLVFWHPNGAAIRDTIEQFWREVHARRGYKLVYSPHIANAELWRISGHLENYTENMYSPIDVDGTDFIIKPMNCPFHILMYKSAIRSYRDLPFRWAELGTVYRYEKSGVLHGMLRVRGFTQDDAHIFCREDQLESELVNVLELVSFMMKTFGFENVKVMLSTRPSKYVGSPELWDKATDALRKAMEHHKVEFSVDEGGGAFYGPKIDIKLVDAIGREWQGPTIQVDFNLPARFGMTYVGSDGKDHVPVMIHRAVLGSMERFVGTLIEHYGGKFPLWLAPVQVLVIPISEHQNDAALRLKQMLESALVRVEVDFSDNKLGYKIREGQMRKIPLMFVIGEKEMDQGTVSVRRRDSETQTVMKQEDALTMVLDSIQKRI